mmetsp:Transcript_68760/g.201365  ORF Transcript_68760/g.201365 Transcript_68760/m.201365 type:complete len:234 (-) Transcript_68760:33-734(-)
MPGFRGLLTAFGDDIWPLKGGTIPPPRSAGHIVVEAPHRGPDEAFWLEFLKKPQKLQSTDLTSQEWIGQRSNCSTNVTRPDNPFWHPRFEFKSPVQAVRVELRAVHENRRLLWHAVFAGRPGNDFTVPNNAPPKGGKQPLFPEFCPPLPANALYELTIRDPEDIPTFKEVVYLRPRKGLKRVAEIDAGMLEAPRPATTLAKGVSGAVGGQGDMVIEEFDPETGDPIATPQHFL